MALTWIAPRFVDAVWSKVADWLQSSIALDPSYLTIDQLQLLVRRGAMQLLVWEEGDGTLAGVAAVEFIDHPKKRIAHIAHLAGNHVVRAEVLLSLSEWCKSQGAIAIECWCDAERSRLYRRVGFTESATVMRLEL